MTITDSADCARVGVASPPARSGWHLVDPTPGGIGRPVGWGDELAAVQRLIADLGSRFITLEPDAIDAALTDGLRQLGEALHLDRVILWQKHAETARAVPTHHWLRNPQGSLAELPMSAFPVIAPRLSAGEAVWFDRLEDLPANVDRASFQQHGLRSGAMVPVTLTGSPGVWGALACSSTTAERHWTPLVIDHLRVASAIVGQALARKDALQDLQRALGELEQFRKGPRNEGASASSPVIAFHTSRLIVAESDAIRRALKQAEQVAETPATVLLLGETGVGKEVFAQAIHELSARRKRQMIRVSCAAIPATLIESELFGRERGAYTGALTRQIGRFEAAHQSTLFLDEIGELSADVQIKLLRVLQERSIERLGSADTVKVDVRIIAATNRNLEKAVEDKSFREDLFYRLNVFPITVPPLRERVEDIPGLVWQFVRECSRSFGKSVESISNESMRELQGYAWPGNVRELRNVVERAVIVSSGPQLAIPLPRSSGSPLPSPPAESMTLKNFQIQHIRATLERTNWRIRGAGGAAERLGLKPTTLETRMAKLGVVRPKPGVSTDSRPPVGLP